MYTILVQRATHRVNVRRTTRVSLYLPLGEVEGSIAGSVEHDSEKATRILNAFRTSALVRRVESVEASHSGTIGGIRTGLVVACVVRNDCQNVAAVAVHWSFAEVHNSRCSPE